MTQQFTASEVRTESCKQGQLHRQPASDMLNAFADLLEAREKAVPVAWRADWPGWRQYHDEMDPLLESLDDDAPEILPLYTHPAKAQPPVASVTDAMVERAQDCLHDKGKDIGYYHMRAALETALAAQENPNG